MFMMIWKQLFPMQTKNSIRRKWFIKTKNQQLKKKDSIKYKYTENSETNIALNIFYNSFTANQKMVAKR